MKKQRWRFTKIPKEFWFCTGCGKKLHTKNKYHQQYGFCNSGCGMKTYGLNSCDFY